MKVVVTGAAGFLGKNLVYFLKENYKDRNLEIFEFDLTVPIKDLYTELGKCDFIFHLAGVNRSNDQEDFTKGNVDLTKSIVDFLIKEKKKTPVLFSSSIQSDLDNIYGKSKKEAENIILHYSDVSGSDVYIYKLPNLFGKWSRPNYNSVIATFCYNLSRGLDITINNRNTVLNLAYIDDVIKDFSFCLWKKHSDKNQKLYKVSTVYEKRLGEISDLLFKFKNIKENFTIPDIDDTFEKKLYSTYLSYVPITENNYKLLTHSDERGSFTEIFKGKFGQVSVNVCNPGITKGNHYHHTKTEKFCVIKGKALIKFRNIITNETTEYELNGALPEILDIPVGVTHNITNTGNEETIFVIWANEVFDKNNSDTYYCEV